MCVCVYGGGGGDVPCTRILVCIGYIQAIESDSDFAFWHAKNKQTIAQSTAYLNRVRGRDMGDDIIPDSWIPPLVR